MFFSREKIESVITVLGVQGRAEWNANRECLGLSFYHRVADGSVKLGSFLLPHGYKEIQWNKDRVTAQHVSGFMATLASYSGELEGAERTYYLQGDGARGYIHPLPPDCLPWFKDQDQEFEAFLNQASFHDLLRGRFAAPKDLEPRVKALKPKIEAWLKTPELQDYLESKALELGGFWANKVRGTGTCGDGLAGILHLSLLSNQPQPTLSDSDALAIAITKDAISRFDKGMVPFYSTDYGIGHELAEILERNGLNHLSGSFPWKTWRHLGFSDAPKFSI